MCHFSCKTVISVTISPIKNYTEHCKVKTSLILDPVDIQAVLKFWNLCLSQPRLFQVIGLPQILMLIYCSLSLEGPKQKRQLSL